MCTRYVAKLENFLFKMTKKRSERKILPVKKEKCTTIHLNTRRISFKINKYEQD